EGDISIVGEGMPLYHDATSDMGDDVGAELIPFTRKGDLGLQRPVEIFSDRGFQRFSHPLPQGIADVDPLSGDGQFHAKYPTSSGCRSRSARQAIEPPIRSQAIPSPLYSPAAARQFCAALSRRRCTEDGMRIASRYLATVLRAMSIPVPRNISTMRSSDSTASGGSWSISALIRYRTASAECASPLRERGIAVVKKYFSSNSPRGVAMYLFDVTRLTVLSCMSMASATSRRISGRRCSTPWWKKASCRCTISVATFSTV